MRQYSITIIAFLCYATTLTICNALPVSNSKQELDVFNIPLSNGKELDVLTLGDESDVNERNKRTIGILRDLFPEISKQVEDQVNKIVAQLIRSIGPTVLRTAIQGNARNRPSPADDFDADFDDDDVIKDDDTSSSSSNSGSSTSSTSSSNNSNSDSATRIKVELPTFKPDDDDNDDDKDPLKNDEDNETKLTGGSENSLDLNAINQQLEETIRVARQTNLNENALANSINSEAVNDLPKTDQEVSESKAPAIDELTLDSLDDADGDDRNKRQGLFGGGGGGAGGAGSGNFLFDIIRLFSGSVQSQGGDQRNNDASDSDGDSDEDGDPKPDANSTSYTEGIPGPVTRLVVLANRGLANLIQDLILRVASTSERLVNFKARLITALI